MNMKIWNEINECKIVIKCETLNEFKNYTELLKLKSHGFLIEPSFYKLHYIIKFLGGKNICVRIDEDTIMDVNSEDYYKGYKIYTYKELMKDEVDNMKTYKINEMLEFEVGTNFKSETGAILEVRHIDYQENKALWFQDDSNSGRFIPLTSEWLKCNFRLIEQQVTWEEVMKSTKRCKTDERIVKLLGNGIDIEEPYVKDAFERLYKGEYISANDMLIIFAWKIDRDNLRYILQNGKFYLEP